MKKTIFGLSVILIAMATVMNGCKKEEPKIDTREAFIGSYKATESYTFQGQTISNSYGISVTKSTVNEQTIVISNFGDSGQNVTATINGTSMVIPQTTLIVQSTSIGISGSGTLNGTTLNYSYSANGPGGQANVTVTALKQ